MIRDVMVWLDGGAPDEIRLAAVADMARWLESRVVVGLYLNVLPLPGPIEGDVTDNIVKWAREEGDEMEAALAKRLQMLDRAAEIRRFDILADDVANIAAREARSADTFVALRPNGATDPERLVEGVLFGSGRNVFLVRQAGSGPVSRRSDAVSAQGETGLGRGRDPRTPDRGRGGDGHRCRQSSQASWHRCRPSSHQEPPQRGRGQIDGRG